MTAIRIRTTLTSDTPHLPELGPLVGRRVEIIVTEEEPSAASTAPPDKWDELARLAGEIREYDWDAWRQKRDFDAEHAEDHTP